MKRIKDEYLDKIETEVSLQTASVLEIGCGNGARSLAIAGRCKSLLGIDPDSLNIELARKKNIGNATFEVVSAENTGLRENTFDIIMFTLSLHHIPIEKMSLAIEEAVRVVKPSGYVIFLEPTDEGSFFETEIKFDACDGDEREQKTVAYKAIQGNTSLEPIKELFDETIFTFDSVDDFVKIMKPKRHIDKIASFLEERNFTLHAKRRINICRALS